ncbi:MAG: response regulator transcription factor [Chloroflexi bacterium]|nr:response regulator transcription factor [Chloroflexota bacterium]
MKAKIRVMLVDDHEVVRLGIAGVLEAEPDISIVAQAGDGESSVQMATVMQPDVVLMDVLLPGIDGIEACRQVKEASPRTSVVMLTSRTRQEAVLAAIMAGASGYLLKNTAPRAIVSAIRSAAAGESMLDPAVTGRVLDQFRRLVEGQEDDEISALSEREKEVLELISEGLTNTEIAERLVLSPSTVRNHVSRVLGKLGLSRRSEAAAFAAKRGIFRNTGQ